MGYLIEIASVHISPTLSLLVGLPVLSGASHSDSERT